MIKIIITDDHKLFRDGIISLLKKHHDFSVLGAFNNGRELLDYLKSGDSPHVILLDINMPEVNGLEVLNQLKKTKSTAKCIALSMHEDGNYIVECVRKGAFGYLLKNTDEEELVLAIKTVFEGKKYFNRKISEKMINNMSVHEQGNGKLSNKEREVIELLSNGLTAKEIADKLIISTRTVETHRKNMMKKLNAKNTAELIAIAMKSGAI